MPADSGPSSYTEYLNTLGELEGFNDCDNYFVVGDFNVDFDRSSPRSKLLCEFMSNLGLFCCDLSFRDEVKFTYERDDGLCRSWIDHILCSQPSCSLVSDVHAIHSGCILSDHFPLLFSIKADLTPVPKSQSFSPNPLQRVDWSRVTPSCIEKYCSMVSMHIPTLPSEVLECSSPSCTAHRTVLDTYGSHLITTLLTCALACFPTRSASITRRRLVGWTQSVNRLKESSMFWYKIWEESDCPSSGVLSQIKEKCKETV